MKKIITSILKLFLKDYYYDLVYWYLIFRNIPQLNNAKQKIVIINHFFDQDIESLKLANTEFELIIIKAQHFRYVGSDLFPKGVDSYSNYNKPEIDVYKKRYEIIIDRLVRKIIKKFNPIAIISPSDGFFYIRQLVKSFQKENIPFIVSDKEGTICPAYFDHFAKYIKETSPLIADHILVWSDRQKAFWEKTGVNSNKIIVVGQPRSDFWKQEKRWKSKDELNINGLRADKKMILFLTYDPWSYTPEYMIEKGEMHWDKLRNETDPIIFDYAKNNPDIDIIIKAHPQQTDIELVKKSIKEQNIPNIILVTGPELSNNLIVNSDCIIGFQTTALIESMVTNKPIIYTFWGEAKDRWSNDLIPFHEIEGISIAQSPDELKNYIVKAMSNPTLTEIEKKSRHDFVMEYLSIIDGNSSLRTLNKIKEIIDKK